MVSENSKKSLVNQLNSQGLTAVEIILQQLYNTHHVYDLETLLKETFNLLDCILLYFEAYGLPALEHFLTSFKTFLDKNKRRIYLNDYIVWYNTFTEKMNRLQQKFIAYMSQIKVFLPIHLFEIREMLGIQFSKMSPENLDVKEYKDFSQLQN